MGRRYHGALAAIVLLGACGQAPAPAPPIEVAAPPEPAEPAERAPAPSPSPAAPLVERRIHCEWDGDCPRTPCDEAPCAIPTCRDDGCTSTDPSDIESIADRERIGRPYPPHNRPELTEAPRPPLGEAERRTQLLFDAIVHDDPSIAEAFFFPRDAFLLVKAIPDPGRYWDRLHARFEADVHALHASTPDLDRAELIGLDLATRGGFMRAGDEGNRLPYWASRHSRLRYRVGDEERTIEVRVLITWDDTWYVIHLSEFH